MHEHQWSTPGRRPWWLMIVAVLPLAAMIVSLVVYGMNLTVIALITLGSILILGPAMAHFVATSMRDVRRNVCEALRGRGERVCVECGRWLDDLGPEDARCPDCGAAACGTARESSP